MITTPGLTPVCMVHVVSNATFADDTLFVPDGSSARDDLPGGDTGQLYDSIQKVLTLPDEIRLFICHDFGPGGRANSWETMIGQQHRDKIHVGDGRTHKEFIKSCTERDAQLLMPKLTIPLLQVDMRVREIPCDDSDKTMLKVSANGI